jgi:D-glycero-alpha-D-manno-heptose-7-phosphate kinase
MIITNTPYRVSLFGGGSDYNDWLTHNTGSVVSFTIKMYSRIILRTLSAVYGSKYRLRYYKREEVSSVSDINHPIIRHCLREWIKSNKDRENLSLDIIHSGDLPAQTGMGTSSCFTVGLILALATHSGESLSDYNLAHSAMYIEQVLNNEAVGCQDQIAAAYGGFNYIAFLGQRQFNVIPLQLSNDWLHQFTRSLVLVYTGLTRDSSLVSSDLISNIPVMSSYISELSAIADDCKKSIELQCDPITIGRMLDYSWKLKRKLTSKTTSNHIDCMYEYLLASGAIGGKLLGAGGGGFLLVFVPEDRLDSFHQATSSLTKLPVNIDWKGATATLINNS